MASNDLYQGGEIPPKVQELLQQYEALQAQIDQERAQDNSGKNRRLMEVGSSGGERAVWQAYNEAIASLEAQKQEIWEQLRRLDPVLAGEIKVNPPQFAEIQNLIDQPTTAILNFYTTDTDTHIFILRHNQITLHTCVGQGLEILQNWILQNWLLLYVNNRNKWTNQIRTILSEIAQRLQLPELISQHLEGIEELILVPHLTLHQVPFAALPISGNQYLGEKFSIRHTPSCQILKFCQERGEVETFHKNSLKYGIVEDATDDLACASFEGEQIARLYNISSVQRLTGKSQATKAKYRQLAEQVQVLHSCHHAESCLYNPLESQLKLADGSITLGQLMTPSWRLPNLFDVFLSCCETNLGTPSLTDDILTLSTGFLCAGARSVVSTLWAVDDLATALFSIFYYQQRKQGKSRPEALRQAQIKLRQLKKDELLRRDDFQELSRQTEIKFKEAKIERDKHQQGSTAHSEWTRNYLKYGNLNSPIKELKNSNEELPFSHPRY
jgi:CHAT domain-containing protein